MITIVDCGIGNIGSIRNMLKRISVPALVTGDPHRIAEATKILLPGVGAFDGAIERIDAAGLRPVLDRKVMEEQTPILGICLGMHLMTRGSEEGKRPGFGWIPADVVRFPALPGIKVPHMGWNLVRQVRGSPLTAGLGAEARFYFVHSFHVRADEPGDSILRTHHGVEFDSAFQRGNIYGAQFHPEKSHRFGMQLLTNFSSL